MISRRDFLKVSGMAIATGFGQASTERSVQTSVLEIGYVESGNPRGVPVILLHGFPDTSSLWRHQLPALVGAGFRVVAPDLRGRGQSDNPLGPLAIAVGSNIRA